MNFFITLLIIRASVSIPFFPDNTHFSFIHIVENYYLQGQMRHRQMSPSVFLCAQLWLKKEEK